MSVTQAYWDLRWKLARELSPDPSSYTSRASEEEVDDAINKMSNTELLLALVIAEDDDYQEEEPYD